ncbi:MAG: hypothetical protein OXF88_04345 [Rhodobacteraceae bacterium]|nr:hypothetical protein [Paracoccaceae bacterium]MCY4138493.1 hypothetical protein [Paracoccaceae bacterium]
MKRLSVIHSIPERLETEIEKHLHKIEALRQSTLAQAFSGWIAARKPDDEHSSVLPERIKTEWEERSRTGIIPRKHSCVAVAA